MNLAPELIGVAGIVVGLISYMWLKNDKALERKVDVEQFNELKASVEGLSDKIDNMRDSETKTALMLVRIEGQMERVVSHLESERGTRDRADQDLSRRYEKLEITCVEEIRALRQGLVSYGRRASDREP